MFIITKPMEQTEKLDMSDSEIISLLKEYEFKEHEMPQILKGIKQRDLESVLAYAEMYRTNNGALAEREETLAKAREYEEERRREEARLRMYKESLLQKIEANRKERARLVEAENKALPVVEKTQKLDAAVKVKAVLNDKETVVLGFAQEATVAELLEKLQAQTGATSLEVRLFGHVNVIASSDKKIVDTFHAKSIMIDVTYK